MKKLYITFALLSILGLKVNAQWQPSSCYAASFCFAINGDTIFTGTGFSGYGIYLSPNNGNSWYQVTGLPNPSYVYAIANKGDTIFAGTSKSGIYLSSNGGNSWNAVNTGLTKKDVYALAIRGNNIYAGTDSGGVFLSTNNGGLWTAVNTGLTNTDVKALAIKGDSIFAGTTGGVFLSTNNGGLWSATGLTDTVQTFAINGNNIFAGTYSRGIFLSSNGGSSWNAVNTGLTNYNVNALVIYRNSIFASGGIFFNGNGVFMSSNNGSSWAAVNTGLIDIWALNVNALVVNKDTIFAGTDSIIWKRPLSELTGIKEINNITGNIVVYPNPATNNITLVSQKVASGGNQETIVEILNIQGQIILQQPLQQGKTNIDIRGLAKGVYILMLHTNEKTEVTRVVKE